MPQEAFTYTVNDAIAHARVFVKNVPVTAMDDIACDTVSSTMYTYRWWRWTMEDLTAITLVDGTQDYSPTDSDLYRLRLGRLTRTDTTPDEDRELRKVDFLSPDLIKRGPYTMQNFSWVPKTEKIRLNSAVGLGSGETWVFNGDYQKKPSKLVVGTGTFFFPDQYFPVFIEGLKWQFYQFADDPRAGSVQFVNGRSVYTGQWGVFMSLLENMARSEDEAGGESFAFPSDPLGTHSGSGGSGFPFA